MLKESLKRCTASISNGRLGIAGQKFLVSGLSEVLPRLKEALISYDAKLSGLKIELVAVSAAATSDKLEEDKQTQERKRELTEDQIANHPALKSIQALFPGSSIESIRSK